MYINNVALFFTTGMYAKPKKYFTMAEHINQEHQKPITNQLKLTISIKNPQTAFVKLITGLEKIRPLINAFPFSFYPFSSFILRSFFFPFVSTFAVVLRLRHVRLCCRFLRRRENVCRLFHRLPRFPHLLRPFRHQLL